MAKISKVTIVFIILLIAFIPLSIFFETPVFFTQPSVEPIRVFWRLVPVREIPANYSQALNMSLNFFEFSPPKYVINDLTLTIGEAFTAFNIKFYIDCTNFSQEIDFMSPVGDGVSLWNTSIENEYENKNPPDILISCPSIETGEIYDWVQVWYSSQPMICHFDKPFLKQTSYDTWEAEFLFDVGSQYVNLSNNTFLNNQTYMDANVQKISFKVTLPKHYQVSDVENVNMAQSVDNPDAFVVTKSVVSGETFHLVVVDSNLKPTKSIMDWVSGLGIISTVIGVFASAWYEHEKPRQKRNRNRRKT
jgi:hypothetical protein